MTWPAGVLNCRTPSHTLRDPAWSSDPITPPQDLAWSSDPITHPQDPAWSTDPITPPQDQPGRLTPSHTLRTTHDLTCWRAVKLARRTHG